MKILQRIHQAIPSVGATILLLPIVLLFVSGAPGSAQAQSCAYERDGECDEPGIGTDSCPFGSDVIDCAGIGFDTCALARNGRCDEPDSCPIGSDSSDCRPITVLGPNDCRYANDNECDEPDIGTGSCPAGTDTADCEGIALTQNGQSEGPVCAFAGDGECDEPGIGSGLCDVGTDPQDCGTLSGTTTGSGVPFEHSCQYAFDGECDEPGIGTGNCQAGTDTWDCALPAQRLSRPSGGGGEKPLLKPADPTEAEPGVCLFFGDGECDEPDIGTGLCPANSDGLDCVNLRP